MLRSNPNVQNSYEFVCLEELVPQHHLLRKIHKHIDFSFILEKVKRWFVGLGLTKHWKPLPWMPAITQQISARNSTPGRFMPSLAVEATLQ